MTTFLAGHKSYMPKEVARLASDLMKVPVSHVQPIGQGANSRVFRLSRPDGNYVLKFYFQHPEDPRDRLGTEFRSLSFLWDRGLRRIPRALQAWPQQACALYSLIEGVSPTAQLKNADIGQAVDFLKILKQLAGSGIDQGFPAASEAFFSGHDIINNLRIRLGRLQIIDSGQECQALHHYLQEDFLPLLGTVEEWSLEYLSQQGISWDKQLPDKYRTLSPSDFGFHNALRTSSGEVVFLDFEYFGWDDPVKTVSDFLWHPAMNLKEGFKQDFTVEATGLFSDDPGFQKRLKACFPLFGLKWCLIFLNEFVASDMQRRGFAQAPPKDKSVLLLNQLAKAKAFSDRIRRTYKEFPYDV
ncbi:MAG: aminoglycoside phosphotransferase family protein [Candidatus Omnitrophica bacterium]|nr:aminoglycoside phosphotransferase family protein [Candidatus Omnitrophota bacterium]